MYFYVNDDVVRSFDIIFHEQVILTKLTKINIQNFDDGEIMAIVN